MRILVLGGTAFLGRGASSPAPGSSAVPAIGRAARVTGPGASPTRPLGTRPCCACRGHLDVRRIDVRDLSFTALANCRLLTEHLSTARDVAGHDGPIAPASEQWLEEHGVGLWMGPKSMPLWLPGQEYAGHATRSTARAEAAGLRPRRLAETLADVLAWEEGQEHPRGAGLSDDEERELIEALRS